MLDIIKTIMESKATYKIDGVGLNVSFIKVTTPKSDKFFKLEITDNTLVIITGQERKEAVKRTEYTDRGVFLDMVGKCIGWLQTMPEPEQFVKKKKK